MVSILLGAYLLLLVIVNFSPTQQLLTNVVEESLEKKLQTEITIGGIEVGLFNRVTLKDVTIHDQKGKDLLLAGLLSAKIEWASLFRGEVSLRTVSVLDADVKLYTERKGENPNFQFIVDAFSSDEKKDKNVNLRVNSVILRRCNLSYDQNYIPETEGKLNPAHIGVKNLGANISLKRFTPDSLNFRIRALQFQEKSGLDVRSLSLRFSANRKHCDISHFQLELPGTRLAKEGLQANYVLNDSTNFLSTLSVSGSLGDAVIATDDLAFLIPQIRDLNQVFVLSTDFNIRSNSILLNELHVDEKHQHLNLNAKVLLRRKGKAITYAHARVENLFVDQPAILKLNKVFLDKEAHVALKNMGDLNFNGQLDYFKNSWSFIKGNLRTSSGKVMADMKWKDKVLEGKVDLNLLSMKELLEREDVPEQLVLNMEGSADLMDKNQPSATANVNVVETRYREHIYQNISLKGTLKNQHLSAKILSPDHFADFVLQFDAKLRGKDLSNMQLKGHVNHFVPKVLNLTSYFGDHVIATQVEANLKNLDLKHPKGYVQIQNFILSGGNPYHLQNLKLSATPSQLGTCLKLDSDFGKANFEGSLSVDALKGMIGNLVGQRLPHSLETHDFMRQHKWVFNVDLCKSDFFNHVLHLPVSFEKGLNVEGYLTSNGKRFFVSAVADHLKINTTELTNLRVLLRERDKELLSRVQLNKHIGKNDVHFELENTTSNGKLLTDLIWSDLGEGFNRGTFKTETFFEKKNHLTTRILPTKLAINDTIWNILPGEVRFLGDSVNIKRFQVHNDDHSLKIYGKLSKNPSDSLVAELTKIDVEYIMDLAKLNSFSFSGYATGKASLSNTFDALQVNAFLDVPGFCFNDGLMGHAKISGSWNKIDKRLNLYGDIQEEGVGYTKVEGYVGLGERALDLHIYSKNTNTYFLNRYVGDIFQNLRGRTSGHCRVYGPFGKIDFGGKERANITARVGATGVEYNIYDGDVVMTPGKFGFQNFSISDKETGSGKMSGHLLHNHLKNIRYKVNVDTKNLLVYDKGESIDMPFYATTYGTGKVALHGKPGMMEADIEMRPDDKTVLVYTVDSPDSFGDVQLLRFGNTADTIKVKKESVEPDEAPAKESALDIRLNFLVDMNPEATLKVIMDRKTGDHLLVHGYGPIRASFYNKGDFQMFGKLNVDRGVYKMSIQDVIRKDFEFTKGSFINFSGNPFMGDLGLRAIYTVNSASLSDLNIGNNLSDNSVRVNCVLNFSGKVKSPQVSFDLELPSVSEDVQQMVRNLISSEEDMNMQILYLLGVGRFYTYNYSSTEAATSQSQSAVAMKSFLSNTLSSQLNNIISNAVGSSNWSFGANLSTGSVGWSDMEVEGILSGRLLNNRLLINGNFGYRDRPAYSTTTNFVGDFDVRYLLTPGGGVSLKAYSETNDRYFSKSSLTTQGIGILLKRDFTNLKDLFTPRKKERLQNPSNKQRK